MIKAVLFDYGGVMTAGGVGIELTDRLGEALGVTAQQAYTLIGPAWSKYSRGSISEAQLWEMVEAAHGKPIQVSKRAIWNTWEEHMQPLPEMLALIKKLHGAGYGVGLLSNVIPNTAADIREHGGYDAFDFLVLSCEAGYAKPDEEIYKLALEKFPGIRPEEVVFIDDQERFLIPAKELGMQTILARSPAQIQEDLEKLLKS